VKFNTDLFAQRLKEYRGAKSQNEVADEFGINRATISLLENGKQMPTLEILQKFCEKIGTACDSFFIKEERNPILLMMGQLKESDKSKLSNVLERINIRAKYIAISKRCGN
jgi:transcriptional regulator with XRE-family HTH domain